tara:strand:+ start:948 stop:1490 length:543 start_codon:yes stop_codon:yes gene_type:complete
MSSNTLKIVQGIAQAAANAYDGSHDERYAADGKARKAGLSREEGDPIFDKRVIDGFKVKFSGNGMCINYQSEIKLKEVYAGGFEDEIARRINEIKKFLQKEYKAITGESVRITPMKDDEVHVMVQSVSRVHSWVQAHQWFKISGVDSEPILSPSEDTVDKSIRDFLSLNSKKRPSNDTRK